MIPDDAAGRPLSPMELATIADLERRLLVETPEPARPHRATPPRRRWHESTNAVALAALLVAGAALVVVGLFVGGFPGAGAVALSVLATAIVWPLLPRAVGGPVRGRRFVRLHRPR